MGTQTGIEIMTRAQACYRVPELSPGSFAAATLSYYILDITLKKASQLVCACMISPSCQQICFIWTAVLTCLHNAISREIAWHNAGDSTIVIPLKKRMLWLQWKRKVWLSSESLNPISSRHLNLCAKLGVEITTNCRAVMTSSRHPPMLWVWQPRRWLILDGTQLRLSWQISWIFERKYIRKKLLCLLFSLLVWQLLLQEHYSYDKSH